MFFIIGNLWCFFLVTNRLLLLIPFKQWWFFSFVWERYFILKKPNQVVGISLAFFASLYLACTTMTDRLLGPAIPLNVLLKDTTSKHAGLFSIVQSTKPETCK